jgi:hypothetical protein
MADKIITSDATKPDEVAGKPQGLSPAQSEGYKAGDAKALAPITDAGLPGLSLEKGVKTVAHPDGSAVAFREIADGNAQVQSIKTFDGHLVTPGYGDDGALNSLTIKPRGEDAYTLSRAPEGKFDWSDSRTGELSKRDIQVHAGSNPGSTAEIAMYHEGGGATLFAPEAKVQPDVALSDLRSLFGRVSEHPFSSGSALPFNNADGTHVSVFDPRYTGRPGFTAIPEQNGLSAQAEPMGIKTPDGRGVSLGFDSAQKGADGRPLVTTANITEANGNQFQLKRVADTNQWRDSRTGTLRNLEVDRALGTDVRSSAEILIKDLDDSSKTLFFNPNGKAPLLTDGPKIGSVSENAGISARDMNHLQFQAQESTLRQTPMTGAHMAFNGDGTTVSVIDPQYKSFVTATADGEAEHLSGLAEPAHILAKDGSAIGLQYDVARKGADGRALVTSANVYPADGSAFNLKRLGQSDLWKDSRTGEFGEFQVQRTLGADPRNTAEILIKDTANPQGDMFFAPHGSEPKLVGKMSTEDLLSTAKADTSFAHYANLSNPNGWNLMKGDFAKYAEQNFGDLTKLTTMDNESLLQKSEDIGRFLLKEHGGKIALGVAAAASLAIAGKYFFGSNEQPTPAPEPASTLPPLHNLGFTLEHQSSFSKGEILLAPSSRSKELLEQLQKNSKALHTIELEK